MPAERSRPRSLEMGFIRMKSIFSGAVAVILLACVLGVLLSAEHRAQTSTVETKREPVIVELFTSEGCSTCPPADALLARLEDEQPVAGAEAIALEEHVDYWNHQGWVDPYSSAEWTMRQQEYVAAFKGDGAYTPQMVVDGRAQFIGSRIREVMAGIGEASRAPKASVVVAPMNPARNLTQQFTVSVEKLVGGTSGDTAEVWLVITEKGLHSEVNRGENAGKDVHHASIVRWMRKVGVVDRKSLTSFTGNISVKLKPVWKLENLRVVALVQEKKSRRILGAASLRLTVHQTVAEP